jgi:microcystin-dependent protein
VTAFVWATVTAVSPLRVRLDGDTTALTFTPDSLIDPLSLAVGSRVRCEISERRVVIHGTTGGLLPAGLEALWAGAVAPAGWHLEDGSALLRATFAALFAAIGTTYGAGNGSTTFNLPDMRGRVPVGRDTGQSEFDVLGETGGSKTHTLTTAQLPGNVVIEGVVSGGNLGTDGGYNTTGRNFTAGQAHNNLQPYRVRNFIIKL